MAWEYKHEKLYVTKGEPLQNTLARLNEFGEEEWEAVSVWTIGTGGTGGSFVLLKRPKPLVKGKLPAPQRLKPNS
jgi:hypothetical protein